jgi:SAM-dependent methyltransferase/uncharacterized protein YbaR (Trm112 family)
MKARLVALLRCPSDGGRLGLEIFEEARAEIIEGLLTCESCKATFCIDGGIPRFVGHEFYDDTQFLAKHRTGSRPGDRGSVHPTGTSTSSSFGFEWHEYDRFGWEDGTFGPAHTKAAFETQLLFKAGDLDGKLVLDAGCGNGRYSHMATQFGAREVIGVDLSSAVEVAYRNLADTANAHVVQANIFNLPFPAAAFDVVFSIGVLHHTGDTARAFAGLVRLLKPGGTISIDVYRRQSWLNELIDPALRSVTTRMDRRRLLAVSQLVSRAITPLDRVKLPRGPSILRLLNFFVRLEPHHHMLFDWYSAPHADRYRPSELLEWFDRNEVQLVACNFDQRSFSAMQRLRRWLLPDFGMGARGELRQHASAGVRACSSPP